MPSRNPPSVCGSRSSGTFSTIHTPTQSGQRSRNAGYRCTHFSGASVSYPLRHCRQTNALMLHLHAILYTSGNLRRRHIGKCHRTTRRSPVLWGGSWRCIDPRNDSKRLSCFPPVSSFSFIRLNAAIYRIVILPAAVRFTAERAAIVPPKKGRAGFHTCTLRGCSMVGPINGPYGCDKNCIGVSFLNITITLGNGALFLESPNFNRPFTNRISCAFIT